MTKENEIFRGEEHSKKNELLENTDNCLLYIVLNSVFCYNRCL